MEQDTPHLNNTDRLKLAMHLGVSGRVAELLVRMFNAPILTYDEIADDNLAKAHRHDISRLRPVLTPQGIEIHNQHGSGYWIDNVGRANVLRLLNEANARMEPSHVGEHPGDTPSGSDDHGDSGGSGGAD